MQTNWPEMAEKAKLKNKPKPAIICRNSLYHTCENY